MSTPQTPFARVFYRVAFQRLEEAEVLYNAGYYIGSVYLAGYSVECVLKALILNSIPPRRQKEVEAEFRGQRAHRFEWLRHRYSEVGAPSLPKEINDALLYVSSWETSLRYKPGIGEPSDSSRFLSDVKKIVAWADSRI